MEPNVDHFHAHDWEAYLDAAQLFWPSLVTAAGVAVAGAVVGVFVALRREALVALALPHVVAIGAAAGLRMGWATLPPAAVAVTGGVLLVVATRDRSPDGRAGDSPLLAPLYVAGLCLAILLIANSGQHLAELEHLFTGMDVSVAPGEARVAVPVLAAAAATCAALWRRWLLLAQARAAAELAGLRGGRWDAGFLTLLAVVVVVGTDTLGVVMVAAMLFLPPAAVLPWARRVPSAMACAVLVALATLAAGFVLSVAMEWPLSQSVGACGFAAALSSQAAKGLRAALRVPVPPLPGRKR